MDMIDKRLNDKGKNWRHVLKALKVLDYCLHEGSELVVTWARSNLYIIKTLREFQYIDEEGRDVGQNVRIAAKELTTLILDDDRLRIERSDRKSWKSRVTGLDEYDTSTGAPPPRRTRPPHQQNNDDEDTEYRLAIEASKHQEEEDRKKREGKSAVGEDDDLAKAIKLSKEEEEARHRREFEDGNEVSLLGDEPVQQPQQPSYTGFNQGYQQGSAVDFFANPIDQNQILGQPTGFIQSTYTGFQQSQPTGFANYHQTGYGMQSALGTDPFGQQQGQPVSPFHMQATGYNNFTQQQPSQAPAEPAPQPGSNNPWATNNNILQQSLTGSPPPSGSNNPFGPQFNRPQTAVSFKSSPMSSLVTLPEQKSLSTFHYASTPSFASPSPSSQQQQQQQQKPMSDHELRLNALLASGEGMDTFGNTGNLRIPAQHTAPGTFVNSAGAGVNRLTAEATGNNPFLRPQATGLPSVSYGTQPQIASMTGYPGMHSSTSNPFSPPAPPAPSSQQNQDLIQF
jgi:epsin